MEHCTFLISTIKNTSQNLDEDVIKKTVLNQLAKNLSIIRLWKIHWLIIAKSKLPKYLNWGNTKKLNLSRCTMLSTKK